MRNAPLYPPPTPNRRTFSATMMEENLDAAENIIEKWDLDRSTTYTKVSFLFSDDRREANEFLRSVAGLQSAMHFFAGDSNSDSNSSDKLVRAQSLMRIAVKRLEREFYQILSKNRSYLDRELVSVSVSSRSSSSSEESCSEDDSVSVSETTIGDLKSIADTMIAIGYGKECMNIYKIVRKSIMDESLYNLGVIEKLSSAQVQKMDWEMVESRIATWLKSVKSAVNTIFHGERILCDYVFSASKTIAESCFSEIVTGAVNLFNFPENVAKSKKLSPEKMFRILDIYYVLLELWPEIEYTFSYRSTSAIKSQAYNSLTKLSETIKLMLGDFEAAIQKETSKSALPGCGVHPLTRYVMNYVVFLSDYESILADIVEDSTVAGVRSPLPESYFQSKETPALSVRLAWIILVLLCKLDAKAELYRDVSLSYLFLANNLNYVVSKVRSSKLRFLIGDDWVKNHEDKVRLYVRNYERMGWSKVTSSLPDPTAEIFPQAARDCFKSFSTAFEDACRKQCTSVVPDKELRDGIKASLWDKIVPVYRGFHYEYREMFRHVAGAETIVRFAPEDVERNLSGLFSGTTGSGSVTTSSGGLSPSASPSRHRGVH